MISLAFRVSAETDPRWDSFVAANDDPHFEQTTAWADAQQLRGWTPWRLLAQRGNSLVGAAQILERRLTRFGRIAYLNRGPLVAKDDDEVNERFVEELVRVSRRRRYLYLAVVLPYHGGHLANILRWQGFAVLPPGFPPCSPMKHTCVLDLSGSEESLLAGMHATTRKDVRRSMRRGLDIHFGTESDVTAFERLLGALYQRRGVAPDVPRGDFLVQVWRSFAQRNQGAIFVATLGSVPVAAVFVLMLGDWARAWRRGWSGDHADLHPNQAVDWQSIRWAKTSGCHFYDFCGIDTRMACRIVRGEAVPADEFCGASRYKLGYGGQITLLQSDYCYSSSPVIRLAIRHAGKRLSQWPFFRRLLRRFGTG